MLFRASLVIPTKGRGTCPLTHSLNDIVKESAVSVGLCHVFIHHTSASLICSENADATVRADLERFLARLVPDGDGLFQHTLEGPDDMPAHVRSVLTLTSISLPVSDGRCDLGTWQGVYLWEHRHAPHRRRLTVTVQG